MIHQWDAGDLEAHEYLNLGPLLLQTLTTESGFVLPAVVTSAGDSPGKIKKRRVIIEGRAHLVDREEERDLIERYIAQIKAERREIRQKSETRKLSPTTATAIEAKRQIEAVRTERKRIADIQERLTRLMTHQALLADEARREAAMLDGWLKEQQAINDQYEEEAIALLLALA